MTATPVARASAFLRRAGLFAAVLAIIAGILGMHVMTGTHSGHSPATVTATTTGAHAGAAAADGHNFHQLSGTPGAHAGADSPEAAGSPAQMCSCSDSGTGMQAMTMSCTPSVKTGALSAPCPGSTVFGIISQTGVAGTLRGDWTFLPRTPSPGELSISRT
ncbi:hypothetical protein [Arthrobacter sp. UYEF20]|uniref:hypothetical protein n=1 Tax=Arthrobacter sp. UYEF20 TaxID=1756363 RepID=UPI0033998E34